LSYVASTRAPITVRLSEPERLALDELVESTGLRQSDLLRLGLAAVVTDVGQVLRFVQAGQRGGGEAAPPPVPARKQRKRGRR
jgi:hypothetical protein